jgi:hypothetical protein
MKLNLAVILTAAGVGLHAIPAAADAAAEAVWAELTSIDAELTAREDFLVHIDFSDEGGLSYYEVRALLHHFDITQYAAISHACFHVEATPSRFMEQTYDFCRLLENALTNHPPEIG